MPSLEPQAIARSTSLIRERMACTFQTRATNNAALRYMEAVDVTIFRANLLVMAGSIAAPFLVSCGTDAVDSSPSTAAGSPNVVVMGAPAPIATPTATPAPAASSMSTPTSTPIATALVLQVGDSIGAGLDAGGYLAINQAFTASEATVVNASTVGRTMETGFSLASTQNYPFRITSAASVLIVEQGTNDLAGPRTGVSLHDDILVPFVAEAKRAGFYIVVNTILPRSDRNWTSAMEQQRLAYNALVRSNDFAADAIDDWAADTLIGDAAGSNTAYFYDGLHPSLLGQQRLAVLDRAAILPLLKLAVRAPS